MTTEEYLSQVDEEKGKAIYWIADNFSKIGIDMSFFLSASDEEIIKAIKKLHPTSMNYLYGVTNVIRHYYDQCDCGRQLNIDYKQLWGELQEEYRKNNSYQRKFIDPKSLNNLLFMIRNLDETRDVAFGIDNGLWLATFVDALWQGIFSNHLTALYNLSASDVHGNLVDVKSDEEKPYTIEVTNELAENLIKVSQLRKWLRHPGAVEIQGKYPDSCFKFERRREDSDNYRHSYMSRIRKIYTDHLDYKLQAKNIYISGLVMRITKRVMEFHGFDDSKYEDCLRNIFEIKDKRAVFPPSVKINIEEELERCNYQSGFHTLRRYIAGHIEDFIPEPSVVENAQNTNGS